MEDGLELDAYWSSACPSCSIRGSCTTSSYRRLKRWRHEAVLEAMQQRLDRQLEVMSVRRQTMEYPFGTLKHWMGETHFLTRTLPRVSAEMSLHVLAYNLKRLMSIVGVSGAMEALRA